MDPTFSLSSPTRDRVQVVGILGHYLAIAGQVVGIPGHYSVNRGMDGLVPVIGKLQDVFQTAGHNSGIDLPQIVVVGSQSCGKSSVLENIVGRDFLPRGTGIVTRVPLIIQLKTVPPLSERGHLSSYPRFEEWAEFLHTQAKFFSEFDCVKEEIVHKTEEITGQNKGISHQPITLKIFSPNVVNLTMVDLPGLTKVPVGDQPEDIETQIRSLVMEYISNDNSIILAVSAANNDIANSESLKLAREVDPMGERTLAVITKIDLMDKGTDASNILTGELIDVKLGIIGIINRSQFDIDHGVPIKEALKKEETFFKNHYPALSRRSGTGHLSRTLNTILLHRIRSTLPILRNTIMRKQSETSQLLERLGGPLESATDKGHFLLTTLTQFAETFNMCISGSHSAGLRTLPDSLPLDAGATVSDIFFRRYAGSLEASFMIHPLRDLTDTKIMQEIKNTVGPRPLLLVPDRAFESLVKRQIQRLEQPSIQCVEDIKNHLSSVLTALCHDQLLHMVQSLRFFPTLVRQIHDVASGFLTSCVPEASKMVRDLIAIEVAYINTDHPDFHEQETMEAILHTCLNNKSQQDPLDAMSQALSNASMDDALKPVLLEPSKSAVPRENTSFTKYSFPSLFGGSKHSSSYLKSASKQQESEADITSNLYKHEESKHEEKSFTTGEKHWQVDMVKTLISKYFAIVKRNISDSVPKAIMHFLVNRLQRDLSKQLVSTLYKENLFHSLLEEDPEMERQRREAQALMEALNKAMSIISEHIFPVARFPSPPHVSVEAT
eukprot:gene8546-993_t